MTESTLLSSCITALRRIRDQMVALSEKLHVAQPAHQDHPAHQEELRLLARRLETQAELLEIEHVDRAASAGPGASAGPVETNTFNQDVAL